MQTPFFTHDCNHCQYLGSATISGKDWDFYAHESKSSVDLIWRYGSEGPDYGSSPIEYISGLSPEGLLAFGLYTQHLGVTSANGCYLKGTYFKNDKSVLTVK